MLQALITLAFVLYLYWRSSRSRKRADIMQQFVTSKEIEHQLELLNLKKQLSIAETQLLESNVNLNEVLLELTRANELAVAYKHRHELNQGMLELYRQIAADSTDALSRAKAAVTEALTNMGTDEDGIADIMRIIDNEP